MAQLSHLSLPHTFSITFFSVSFSSFFLLEMHEKQRQGEPGDLIQVPLFDSAPRGRLSRGPLQHQAGRQQWGFLKEKSPGLWGVGEGLISCSFRKVPQGSRLWAGTTGQIKGWAVPRYKRVSLATGLFPGTGGSVWPLAIVAGARHLSHVVGENFSEAAGYQVS